MNPGDGVKAKRVAQALEGRSKGAKLSLTEVPTPRESPQPEAGGSSAALPIETVPHREQILETTHEILAHVHTLRLQTCTRWWHAGVGLNSSSNPPC